MSKKFTAIEGGLAGLDDLMAEFAAQDTTFEFIETDREISPAEMDPAKLKALLGYDPAVLGDLSTVNLSDIMGADTVISEGAMSEFEHMTDTGRADEFEFRKGSLAVDLD